MKRRVKTPFGVIGVDEVGRGPLAGPVTLCAFYIEDEKEALKEIFHNTIRDSKKLNKDSRLNIYQIIRKNRLIKTRIEYAISSRSAEYIDKHGISHAVRQCLVSCMRILVKKGIEIEKCTVRLDAGLRIPLENLAQQSFVKGDERFVEIALASIMAKVSRDMYMERLGKEHKEYLWEKNAGYGTVDHREAIKNIGITKYHRRTYLKAFKLFDKI